MPLLSAVEAFKLVDTYGLPREIMAQELKRRGWTYDEKGFDRLMEEQRERGRADRRRRSVTKAADKPMTEV